MKTFAALLSMGVFLLGCATRPEEYPEADFSDMIEIAPLDEALTFARTGDGESVQLWAVGEVGPNTLTGFNLTRAYGRDVTDPIDLFIEEGYAALHARIEEGLAASPRTIDVADLILPVELRDSHIAVGTNFPEHAEESEVQEGPFLFAKEVVPTPSGATVSAGDALLDYEVELAFVTLEDAPLPQAPERMGLILANDFTDRATLMRHLNPHDVTSGDGFTTGKSAPGYLPVGNLFVIPRDMDAFVAATGLTLAVNGQLRQQAPMTDWIWDIDEIFRQTDARRDVQWDYQGGKVGLPIVDGAVPARTLVLAGTPHGTIFQGIPPRNMAFGVMRWLAFGWGKSLPDRVIESTIKSAKKEGNYLQPGDRVLIRVERLGTIETTVVE